MPNGPQYANLAAGYKGTWVDQLLKAIGAPTTDSNRAALRLWAASEGTIGSNNPLAISTAYPGSTHCIAQCGSRSPIYAYSSINTGTAATAQFLGGSNYNGVVGAFRSDAGLGAIWSAINSSPWCSGCQGGFYPVALAQVVRPGGSAPAGSTAGVLEQGTKSTAGSSGGHTTIFGKAPEECAIGSPGVVGIGKFCLLNYAQLQAMLGGALVVAGGLTMLLGIGVVVAFGLPRQHPLQKVAPTRIAGRAVSASRTRRAAGERQAATEAAQAAREETAQRRAAERAALLEQRQAGQREAREHRAREARLRERRARSARDRERQSRMTEREHAASAGRYRRGEGAGRAREEPFA